MYLTATPKGAELVIEYLDFKVFVKFNKITGAAIEMIVYDIVSKKELYKFEGRGCMGELISMIRQTYPDWSVKPDPPDEEDGG